MQLSQKKKLGVGFGLVVGAAVVGWLAFGVFGIQAAFIDNEVDEGGPVFASGAGAETGTGVGDDVADVVVSEEFTDAMADAAENQSEVDENADDVMEGEIVTIVQGSFTGYTGHSVVGDAVVLNDGTEQRFLRLEGFDSTNGPDLNVYLRAEDGEIVDLGDLKGNIGDQNYEIPTDVDLERFDTVQIWCVRFGVLFGDAILTA